jgi:hypothetical protein
MKTLVATICAAAIVVAALNVEAKTMYAGVKGGLNIGSLTGDDADNLDPHNGFIGGGFYGIDFTDDFGMRIEGLYVMGGAEGPYNTLDGDTHDAIIRLDYLQFPVLFVVNIPLNEKIAFDVTLGPTFSFNTSATAEIPEHGETEDVPNVNGFEFGAAIGGGFEYKLSSFSLLVDARYYAGATNVVDVDPSDLKSRGIAIMAGVKFPLGAK